ncbi:MAG: transposase [Chthoniobacterales bacterium]
MKTQISKPARERTSFTQEYKQEALELWRASGRSAAKIATQLGIRPPLLYRWARTERAPGDPGGGDSAFTGGERQALRTARSPKKITGHPLRSVRFGVRAHYRHSTSTPVFRLEKQRRASPTGGSRFEAFERRERTLAQRGPRMRAFSLSRSFFVSLS